KEAEFISETLFSGDIRELNSQQIEVAFSHVPSVEIDNESLSLVDLLVNTEIEPSKRQAREDIENGAIYIDGIRTDDVNSMINPKEHFGGDFIVIRRGKKKYFLVRINK
ncbi:S4 domain-containing protein, partial [Catellicoccus marimammalium]|uniref:S4 domain-containing protein n=1 Tax=Catellicoccus marimammalium TaxID=300419 RepID=UPI00058C6B70